jgi:ribosome-binding protein aMBF1 (putative translation factor)
MKRKLVSARDLHAKWMKAPTYRDTYNELEDEFALAAAMIAARGDAGLTQDELAKRMGTTATVISRLESGRVRPSTRTLERFAEATGHKLRISFERQGRTRSARTAARV